MNTRGGTVVLVNPKATYADEIGQKCFPPLGLLHLGASLTAAGFDVRVIDANALRLTDTDVVRRAALVRPFLVGLPFFAETLIPTARLARALRAALPEARIVGGGPHASAMPERLLEELSVLDYVLVGEAEHSLVELSRALYSGAPPAKLLPIEGLVTRGSPRPAYRIVHDIETLPVPQRDLVSEAYALRRYYALLVPHREIDCILTSRGCPFSCNFCHNPTRRMRYRSIESCLEELCRLRERGVRNVEILDANFTADEERAMSFLGAVEKERLGMSLRIKSRADAVTERLLAQARRAGVYQISIGAESGSDRLLGAMNKRETVAQIEKAVALVMRHGINCHTSWIIGYPGETMETLEETCRVVQRMRPTTAGFSILTPYPGTHVYEEARARGTLVGDWSTEGGPLPWVRLPWTRSYRDLQAARTRMLRRVYLRPYYAYTYAKLIATTANFTLARYALQELGRVLPFRRGPA